jgi:hypothetical protein
VANLIIIHVAQVIEGNMVELLPAPATNTKSVLVDVDTVVTNNDWAMGVEGAGGVEDTVIGGLPTPFLRSCCTIGCAFFC